MKNEKEVMLLVNVIGVSIVVFLFLGVTAVVWVASHNLYITGLCVLLAVPLSLMISLGGEET